MGYHRAGFEVIGVDNQPQPRYPFEFHQADAMTFDLEGFDVIHASPPCLLFSVLSMQDGFGNKREPSEFHEDLLTPTRHRLIEAGVRYVIENVPRAPLISPIVLCGSHFKMDIRRHRLFESNVPLAQPVCDHKSQGQIVGVYGTPGGSSSRRGTVFAKVDRWREAMEIDWMVSRELAQAIPPAYTEHIGRQIIATLA